jgi:hypothetical protein
MAPAEDAAAWPRRVSLGPPTELLIEAGDDAVPSSEFEMRMTAVVAMITAMRKRQIAQTNRVERSGAPTCGVVCCVMAFVLSGWSCNA